MEQLFSCLQFWYNGCFQVTEGCLMTFRRLPYCNTWEKTLCATVTENEVIRNIKSAFIFCK